MRTLVPGVRGNRQLLAQLNGAPVTVHVTPPTYVLYDAIVRTCDAQGSRADAVVVRDGRVAAVGAFDDIIAATRAALPRVSMDGAVILPGFVDTHPHVMHSSLFSEGRVDLADVSTHDEIEARFRARAEETPPGEWVMATPVGEPAYFLRRSWRDLAEGCLPDRHVLDRAAPSHPAMIQAWAPVTPNTMVFNTAGLRRLHIDRDSPDRIGNVEIEKEDDGEPSGRLHGAVNLYLSHEPYTESLLRQLPLLNPSLVTSATVRGMHTYNAMGVTAGYEGHGMEFPLIEAYRRLRAEGRLTMRILCAAEAEPHAMPWNHSLSDDEFADRLEKAVAIVDRTDDLLRIDGVTLSRGGPCWPGQLLMDRPYRGPFGEQTTGISFVSRERVQGAIRFCVERGLRLNYLATGLADNETYLTDLETLQRAPYQTNRRPWIVQHIYLVRESQARRLAQLGLDVTTSMTFSWGKGEMIAERIGEDMLEHLVPLQRLLDAGLRVGCGTDWGPKNVFEHIALAVEPIYAATGRPAVTPGIARDAALAMWTRQAAQVLAWDGIGSIEVGHHADLTIVDRDPLTCPLEDLASTKVHATVLGGELVHGSLGSELSV